MEGEGILLTKDALFLGDRLKWLPEPWVSGFLSGLVQRALQAEEIAQSTR